MTKPKLPFSWRQLLFLFSDAVLSSSSFLTENTSAFFLIFSKNSSPSLHLWTVSFFILLLVSVMPVSYTHLDVYKRQVLLSIYSITIAENLKIHKPKKQSRILLSSGFCSISFLFLNSNPVSYTHLVPAWKT